MAVGRSVNNTGFGWWLLVIARTHSIKSGDSYLCALCALGLILASGGTWSIVGLAASCHAKRSACVLLERYPRWGYAIMGFFIKSYLLYKIFDFAQPPIMKETSLTKRFFSRGSGERLKIEYLLSGVRKTN